VAGGFRMLYIFYRKNNTPLYLAASSLSDQDPGFAGGPDLN